MLSGSDRRRILIVLLILSVVVYIASATLQNG
jgi:hypothetical protein